MNIIPFILSLSTRQTTVTPRAIESLTPADPVQVPYNTPFNSLALPAEVEADFTDDFTGTVSVTWDIDNEYDPERSGVVRLIGTPIESAEVLNPDSLTTYIDVDVYREMVVSENYVEFSGAQSLMGSAVMSEFACHFYKDRMLYYDGMTYLTYGYSYQHKPYSQAKLLVHDTLRGIDRPINVGSILTVTDTHNVPAIAVANDRLNILQEPVHDTPTRQYVNYLADYDYTAFGILGTIGTKQSYCHILFDDDGNAILWARGYVSPDSGFYSIWVSESSAGMTPWAAQRQITQKSATAGERHYPFVPSARYKIPGRIYVGWSNRQDTGTIHWRNHIAWTPSSGVDRFRVFNNIQGTYSHDMDVVGLIDETDALNFAYMTMTNNTVQGGHGMCTISPTGKFYAIVPTEPGGGSGTLFLKYWDDVEEEWVLNELTLGLRTVSTTLSTLYLTALSDNDIRYADYFTHGSFGKPHWVRTTDQGLTWEDLGDMNPEITDRSLTMLHVGNPHDIPQDTNFPVYFCSDDAGSDLAKVVCRLAAWGEIQSTPGVAVTAASSMNYNSTGLYDYLCSSAGLTKTGNNVTAIIDQFGIRNATGFNNPQWDGVDAVVMTGASSHRFAIGTPASIVNKSDLTFFCVAKSVGAEFILLNFSLNSATNKYYEITINTNVVRVRMTNTSTWFADGQTDINDGNFHVIAVVTNGANTVHVYVDGVRQYFDTNLVDGSADSLWDDIGTGPLNVTANIAHINFRDLSSGDTYSSGAFKRQTLLTGAMPNVEVQARIKKLCTDHSITYQGASQFQVPS